MAGENNVRVRRGRRKISETIDAAPIVASTMEEAPKVESGVETIAIACSLPFGLRFTDIPNEKGGTKTIVLPGVNQALKGKKTGVLALPGNAVCVTQPKADWDALVRIHGKEIAFTGRNGGMPCIYPVTDVQGFRAAESEIKEMRNGLEPVNPASMGVKETTGS